MPARRFYDLSIEERIITYRKALEIYARKYSGMNLRRASESIGPEIGIFPTTVLKWLKGNNPLARLKIIDFSSKPELAYLFGIFTVSGYIRITKKYNNLGKRYDIIIESRNKDFLANLGKCVAEVFRSKIPRIRPVSIRKGHIKKHYYTFFSSRHFCEFWQEKNKRREYWEVIEKYPVDFLCGIFADTGAATWLAGRRIHLQKTSRSPETLAPIKHAFGILGIRGKIYKTSRGCCVFDLGSWGAFLKFVELVESKASNRFGGIDLFRKNIKDPAYQIMGQCGYHRGKKVKYRNK